MNCTGLDRLSSPPAASRYEAIEKIEESFSTLKVTEFEGNCIRLSLKTYIPHVEGLMHHQKLTDNVDPFELNHELQIEVMNVGMQLKNAEIFPNDVYLGDILEALNSFRLVFLHPTLWKLLLLLSGLLAQSLLLSLALSSKKYFKGSPKMYDKDHLHELHKE